MKNINSARNRLAYGLANWIINTFATKEYSRFIAGAIEYGLRSAAEDERNNAPVPKDWRI